MGLRRKKHGDSCDCAICERERPKPTYISLDEDFYNLSVSPSSHSSVFSDAVS